MIELEESPRTVMNSGKGPESLVTKLIAIVKKGELIPYSLIHEFLSLENGDTMYNGQIHHLGNLGTQLVNAKNSGTIDVNICAKTMHSKDEMYIKLLRIFAYYCSYPMNTLTSPEERTRLVDNMAMNCNLIVLGRDNIPMDENGDMIESYRKMLPLFCDQTKLDIKNSPELLQKRIFDLCDPERQSNSLVK